MRVDRFRASRGVAVVCAPRRGVSCPVTVQRRQQRGPRTGRSGTGSEDAAADRRQQDSGVAGGEGRTCSPWGLHPVFRCMPPAPPFRPPCPSVAESRNKHTQEVEFPTWIFDFQPRTENSPSSHHRKINSPAFAPGIARVDALSGQWTLMALSGDSKDKNAERLGFCVPSSQQESSHPTHSGSSGSCNLQRGQVLEVFRWKFSPVTTCWVCQPGQHPRQVKNTICNVSLAELVQVRCV